MATKPKSRQQEPSATPTKSRRTSGARGRQARTRGVSLRPEEHALIERFEELTGLGFTEQVRELMLAKLPAAVWALEEMVKAGIEPGRRPLVDEILYVEDPQERRARYEDSYEPADLAAEARATAGSAD